MYLHMTGLSFFTFFNLYFSICFRFQFAFSSLFVALICIFIFVSVFLVCINMLFTAAVLQRALQTPTVPAVRSGQADGLFGRGHFPALTAEMSTASREPRMGAHPWSSRLSGSPQGKGAKAQLQHNVAPPRVFSPDISLYPYPQKCPHGGKPPQFHSVSPDTFAYRRQKDYPGSGYPRVAVKVFLSSRMGFSKSQSKCLLFSSFKTTCRHSLF